jgi:hypothetical protein
MIGRSRSDSSVPRLEQKVAGSRDTATTSSCRDTAQNPGVSQWYRTSCSRSFR